MGKAVERKIYMGGGMCCMAQKRMKYEGEKGDNDVSSEGERWIVEIKNKGGLEEEEKKEYSTKH